MKNDVECIDDLRATREWKELQRLAPKFDLLKLFDDAIVENSWSRILSFLFCSDESHGLGRDVFHAWLQEVEHVSDEKLLSKLPTKWKSTAKVQQCTDENRFLDIVVTISNSQGKVIGVVGIENKLDAGEQPNQLGHYQEWICKSYPGIDFRFMVFLTPDGRRPLTANDKSKCCVFSCSYDTVSKACKVVLGKAKKNVHVHTLIKALVDHLEGEADLAIKAQRLVEKLFADENNRRAISLICDFRPTIGRVLELIESNLNSSKVIRSICKGNPTLSTDAWGVYFSEIENPSKGVWLEFCLAVLDVKTSTPTVKNIIGFRVVAWCDDKAAKQHALRLKALVKLPKPMDDYSIRSRYGTSHHVLFWDGGNYTLQDLGSEDVQGLTKLVEEGVKATYRPLLAAIKKLKK